MTLLDELLAVVDRMELALSIAYMELEALSLDFGHYATSDEGYSIPSKIVAAALKCEEAYNAVVASQVDVDIYLESYDRPARS
jgi:hypothetical protein